MKILKPRITVLLDGMAYRFDPWSEKKVEAVDPSMFQKPTAFDAILHSGVVQALVISAGLAFIVSKLLKK